MVVLVGLVSVLVVGFLIVVFVLDLNPRRGLKATIFKGWIRAKRKSVNGVSRRILVSNLGATKVQHLSFTTSTLL